MSMIKWVIGTSTQYKALSQKDPNTLYFLSDTQEIYKGSTSFTQSSELVENFPESGAQGRIYIHSTNLEGRVWTGTTWKTVIQPIAESLTDGEVERKAVSGEAVKTYVKQHVTAAIADKVDGIGYDKEKKQLTYTKGDQTTAVDIGGFVTGAKYNPQSGILSFDVQGGKSIHINIPKDNFVQSGRYDEATKNIILELGNGEEVQIPAGDLIDVTEFESTETVELTTEGGIVKANVKLSTASGNQLKLNGNGLYVEATDISNKLDKVDEQREDEIIIAKADGTVKTSGKKVGGTTLSDSPNGNTLATEAAVSAIKNTLEGFINVKVNKSDIATTIGNVDTALDTKVASEKAVATAIAQLDNNKINKSNITTQIPEGAGSVDNVVSERAVVSALSWVELN